MADNDDEGLPIARFRAPDGSLVVEVDLTSGHRYSIDDVIGRARSLHADKLWVHAHVIDANFGFERRGSYTRLEAIGPPAPVELPLVLEARIPELQRACFGDVWGHHEAGPPDPESIFVGLHERGEWVGICGVDPDTQWIDGPGVVPRLREPERYVTLVRGAAAYVRDAPVVLETWGDAASTISAYVALGFEVVHSVSGWELDFRAR